MDNGGKQEPIFAAGFCVCLASEMNKRMTAEDMATASGVMRKTDAIQKEVTEMCIKSAKKAVGK